MAKFQLITDADITAMDMAIEAERVVRRSSGWRRATPA
jgi:hypothetical protein